MKRVLLAAAVLAIAACNGETTAPSATVPALRTDVISTAALAGSATYNNIPSPLPPNVPSQGYECCQTSEFGDYVRLSGTARSAGSVTVLMSDWAKHSDYSSMDAAGYTHPITLNIYNVDNSTGTPALGTLISSVTQTFTIPWRPESDPTCPDTGYGLGFGWRTNSGPYAGRCFSGFAFPITFDLHSLALTLPSDIIVGIAYNTNTSGYRPIGLPGPYDALNVGTANFDGVALPVTVGTDVEPDAVFWNVNSSGFRRDDIGWLGYSPALTISTFTVATTVNGCMKNGWRSLARANGTTFRTQKECTNYVSGK